MINVCSSVFCVRRFLPAGQAELDVPGAREILLQHLRQDIQVVQRTLQAPYLRVRQGPQVPVSTLRLRGQAAAPRLHPHQVRAQEQRRVRPGPREVVS
jgi:hypothetical protein